MMHTAVRFLVLIGAVLSCPASWAAEVYTLEKAVTTALDRNFTIQAATEARAAAGSGVSSARSSFGPVLGSGYAYDRRQHNRESSGRAVDRELYTWRAYLNQNLFAGFDTLSDYRKAALREDVAEEGVRRARLELIRLVQIHFFTYLKAREDARSASDALDRLRSQMTSSRAFYDVGVSPRIDVLQAEVDVSSAESALLIAENAVQTQKARLNTLLRLPIDADAEYAGAPVFVPFTKTLDECLQTAYKKRPDLIMAEKSVRIAEQDVAKAQSGWYPRLDAYGAWGSRGNSGSVSGSPNITNRFNEWTVGVSAEWRLFEWGKTLFDTRQARHESSRLRFEAENLKQEVGFMIKERILAMSEAAKRIKVAQAALEQAREAYRMADARYRRQVGTMTDVLDAQAKLSQAEASLTGARADYSIALAAVYADIGEENLSLRPR
ncbi:MAG: TolC family protein [Desulfovibrio sp.]|jgi:outer membrane protein|nr:TolC family protein [Desulfovibrio sp.]